MRNSLKRKVSYSLYYRAKKDLLLERRRVEALEKLLKDKTGHFSWEWTYIDFGNLQATDPRCSIRLTNVSA